MSDLFVVTGPTGNVGLELTQHLIDLGEEAPPFRIAAHHPDQLADHFGTDLPDDLPVVHLDYDDAATHAAAFEGASTVFLLFPLPSPRMVKKRMIPLIDAAVAAGVQHVIYLSVPGADRSKVVPHNGVERHLKASGMGWTILRPSYFMQNLVRVISTHGVDIADHDEVFIPAGDGVTTFLDSRDLAEIIVTIARDPAAHLGREYVLPGPDTMTFYDVAEILTDVLGRPITYANPSRLQFWRRLRKRGVGRDAVFFMQIVYTLARRGFNANPQDDTTGLLTRDATDFRQFAQDYKWRWDTQTWT